MNLRRFVSESLDQIIGGVSDAKEAAKKHKAQVSPDLEGREGAPVTPVKEIEFDVAVTVAEGESKKAGAAILIAAIGLGAQGASTISSTTVSRIKFSVPIVFPR